jgi:Isochorismatase family
MSRKGIDMAVAQEELSRIDNFLKSPVLLVGGMAVQQYHVPRRSRDLDIVCDHEVASDLVDQLYPSDKWVVSDENNDAYRPSYRICHRTQDLGEIVIGPKLLEREPYKYVEWSALMPGARPFKHKKKKLANILIPSPAALAFTKLLSFIGRRTKDPDKSLQDLKDFVALSNHDEFALIQFLSLVTKAGASAYVKDNLRLGSTTEAELFKGSSLYQIRDVLGIAQESQPVPLTRLDGQAKPHEMPPIVNEIAKIALKYQGKRPVCTNVTEVLIVVDVQVDFFEGGALAAADTASLLPSLNDLIRRAQNAGMEIVFTRDWHPNDHHSFSDWGPHCVRDTNGAAFHPGLHRPDTALVVDIGTTNEMDGYSPFSDPRLQMIMCNDPNQDRVRGWNSAGVLCTGNL